VGLKEHLSSDFENTTYTLHSSLDLQMAAELIQRQDLAQTYRDK